ncbi:hypothetical protein EJ06DRAFT_61549 [Trichodelitschia bisporula]|uniref:Uncharacterized protein n=1 Tax=Trichodelitschia bisporula TaxID=703511 RepID=A0A6G1HUR3_9PEZI|nr:hypothetical protein EJ06DRAFT_61549 [Trichodelitschia bisporula]
MPTHSFWYLRHRFSFLCDMYPLHITSPTPSTIAQTATAPTVFSEDKPAGPPREYPPSHPLFLAPQVHQANVIPIITVSLNPLPPALSSHHHRSSDAPVTTVRDMYRSSSTSIFSLPLPPAPCRSASSSHPKASYVNTLAPIPLST